MASALPAAVTSRCLLGPRSSAPRWTANGSLQSLPSSSEPREHDARDTLRDEPSPTDHTADVHDDAAPLLTPPPPLLAGSWLLPGEDMTPKLLLLV